MEQNTQEWHDLRRTKIGASDASVILGINPWKTPFQLWEEKVYGKAQEQNFAMARGAFMENEARQCFENMTGLSVMPKVMIKDWRMASLDGITMDGTVIVEIKCGGKELHQQAKEGIIPPYYYAQIQHQLVVSGAEKAFYFSFNGTEGIGVAVLPDPKFIEEMIIAEEHFYYECMMKKEAPMLTEKDFVKKDDDEWIKWSHQWVQAYWSLKEWELHEEVSRKKLIELSSGKNCVSNEVKLTRSLSKGIVDYKSVPELIGVDLEPYRKPHCEKWRLVVNKI